jgi:threonine dehydrogenase-like Zn-dependent dehydrogenase
VPSGTQIHASFSYNRAAWASVVDLLNRSAISPSVLISHRFPLENWEQGLEALRGTSKGPRGKVLLSVHPST